MSLWQYYRNLSAKTRLLVGAGIMAYAGAGLLVSDQAERRFGYTPTEQDKERLNDVLPKIRVVEEGERRD